jgi:DNA repair protein RadC
MPLKDLPLDAQPREKLLARGAAALSDAELLALLLRTGIKGKGVLQMADELLQLKTSANDPNEGFDGIAGLLHASADDLKRVKGLGPAKRAELVAVLELARRALAQQLIGHLQHALALDAGAQQQGQQFGIAQGGRSAREQLLTRSRVQGQVF